MQDFYKKEIIKIDKREVIMKISWVTIWLLIFCFGMNLITEARTDSDENSPSQSEMSDAPAVSEKPSEKEGTSEANGSGSSKEDSPSISKITNISKITKTVDKTCALLFAINDYKGKAGLDPLYGCNNDIASVNEWLKRLGSADEDIQILSEDQAKFPQSQKPTYDNFNEALERTVDQDCNRLIVVCACHGKSLKNKSFLCPFDVKRIPQIEEDEDPLEVGNKNNLISIDHILSELKKSKAKEVLLIMDACRDGDKGQGSFMTEFEDLLKEDSSFEKEDSCFAVITSCSFGQSAHEIHDKDQGAFMFHFMDGLNNRKADYMGCNDGKISLIEAYNYAYSEVSGQFASQTPEIFMSSNNKNIDLMKYEMTADTAEIEKIPSPLQFLLQTGIILCNPEYDDDAVTVGVKALNTVLKNSPNNSQAYAVRGSALRVLKQYDLALLDMSRIHQKCHVFANPSKASTADGTMSLYKTASDEAEQISDLEIKQNSLLTITEANDNYFYVTEVDNKRLGAKCGWVKKENIDWHVDLSKDQIVATNAQDARAYSNTGSYSAGASSAHSGNSVGGSVLGGARPMMGGL